MRRLAVGLSFVCLIWLLAFAETAQAIPRLVAGVVRGFPGRTVEVPVSLGYRTNDLRDVVAFQADVVFDAMGVTDGMPAPGVVISNQVVASSRPATGTRRLLVYSPASTVLTNGELCRIPFSIGPNEYRNFTLRLTNLIMVRANASQVFGTTVDGAVVVNQMFVAPNGHADGFLTVSSNEVEQCYVVQATTDMATWAPVFTNSTTGPLLAFAEADVSSYAHRFYRAVLCDGAGGTSVARLGAVQRLVDGRVRFDFAGEAGQSYVVQASTNLLHWEDVSGNLSGTLIQFTDPGATTRRYRFYRVRRSP